jgi:hypothetical protein
VRLAALSLLCLGLIGASPATQTQIGLRCAGNESLRVGARAARRVAYRQTLSLDLLAGRYCYAQCLAAQTFPIVRVNGSSVILADVRVPEQRRDMWLDLAAMRLEDDQHLAMGGLPPVERHARVSCVGAPFHEPSAAR